jgi:hypothetical protein
MRPNSPSPFPCPSGLRATAHDYSALTLHSVTDGAGSPGPSLSLSISPAAYPSYLLSRLIFQTSLCKQYTVQNNVLHDHMHDLLETA